jgi:hypothetical protein
MSLSLSLFGSSYSVRHQVRHKVLRNVWWQRRGKKKHTGGNYSRERDCWIRFLNDLVQFRAWTYERKVQGMFDYALGLSITMHSNVIARR